MTEVGIRELKAQASDIIRRVRDKNETFIVTYRGRAVARIEPLQDRDAQVSHDVSILEEMDRLADEISKHWPEGVSAADAVAEQRREL
jgi:prevent-host-death family protein